MILRPELLPLGLLLASRALAVETRAQEGSRPRGVGPEFAKFYKSTANPPVFTCISAPSITIPFSSVNDDYCDCPDGSDEPGTSACSYLSPLSPPQYPPGSSAAALPHNATVALPGFYCKNKGHVPSYIRFESVNDGKCDYDLCCDGSDEWAQVGGLKCEDKCKEIGKEWKKGEEKRLKALQAALKKKAQLQADADRLKKEAEQKIGDLETKLKAHEVKVRDAEAALKDVEKREKLRVVQGGAAGKGSGKLGVLLNLSKSRVEELRASLSKTKVQRDAMVGRITELEGLLSKLKEDYNPNFNDEGVKAAVRGWEDYAARDTTDHWSDAEDRDLAALLAEDGESSGVNWSEFESDDAIADSDVAALYSFTAYLPPTVQTWLDDKISAFRQLLVENGVLPAPEPAADVAESKAVKDAKQTLTDAERDVRNVNNDIKSARDELDKDFGPDGIFRALKDTCVTRDSGEYEYELCFMRQTKQKSKKGGAHTGMGNFVGFDTEITDDILPADGKGLGSGERLVLKFENGQGCWNGPQRSTRVILACSETDEIWKVSESEKCVYRMEVGTVAVCEATNGKKPERKDEL